MGIPEIGYPGYPDFRKYGYPGNHNISGNMGTRVLIFTVKMGIPP